MGFSRRQENSRPDGFRALTLQIPRIFSTPQTGNEFVPELVLWGGGGKSDIGKPQKHSEASENVA